MMAVFIYLVKATLVSGFLYGYYHWFLKEKTFHIWNRYYLLGTVLLSMILPLVRIDIFSPGSSKTYEMIEILSVVNSTDEYFRQYDLAGQEWVSFESLMVAFYGSVSLVLLCFLLTSMIGIYKASRNREIMRIGNIRLIESSVAGTPFSFFNLIFWNKEIDIHSETGRKIIDHEIVHIRQKHSFDKLFLEIVMVFFWLIPSFWLIRRELRQIHEFLADRETIPSSDTGMLARLILSTGYPSMNNIVNPFFQSSLKRRLTMIKKSSNPDSQLMVRMLAFSLMIVMFLAFSINPYSQPGQQLLDRKVTVVIDAGHGASDPGVVYEGLQEKDLTLSLSRFVKELNRDENLTVILTRSRDEYLSLADRTEIAREKNADLFISLHIGYDERSAGNKNGIEVYIPNNHSSLRTQSQLLASALVQNFRPYLKVADSIYERSSGIFVLNQNSCPSALVELGYLNNAADRAFISNRENQEKIAGSILKSIADYFGNSQQSSSNDYPEIKQESSLTIGTETGKTPLFIIGEAEVTAEELKLIDKEKIKSVSVWKNEEAIKKYGEKGKNGVIVIELK